VVEIGAAVLAAVALLLVWEVIRSRRTCSSPEQTGGGKGGLIRLVASSALKQGWTASILDPKGRGEHRWAYKRRIPVVHGDLRARRRRPG
jgi:hypothetical protein